MPDTPDQPAAGPETILAFDFGLRRIGVAVGQSITGSASPLGIVANSASGPDFPAIAALVSEWRPTRLVVGLPYHADGSDSEMLASVRTFVDELGRFGLPVATVDERYSSVEAQRLLKDARASGNRGRIRKSDIDTAAAVCIAERFLSAN
jgi:putative Holliday junction resolvase